MEKRLVNGKHFIWIEDENVACFEFHGAVDGADAIAIQESLKDVAALPEGYYLIIICSDGNITPEARSATSDWFRKDNHPAKVCVAVGLSSGLKVLLSLMFRGFDLIFGHPLPLVFADSVEEARAVIRRAREKEKTAR